MYAWVLVLTLWDGGRAYVTVDGYRCLKAQTQQPVLVRGISAQNARCIGRIWIGPGPEPGHLSSRGSSNRSE